MTTTVNVCVMDVNILGENKMKKVSKVLYYVIKYDGKYYAPYQNKDSFDNGHTSIDKILTADKRLALRFGEKDLAEWSMNYDAGARKYYDPSYDPSKAKIVKIVSKRK